MQIQDWFLTDGGLGPTVRTYEEARQIQFEHCLRDPIQHWFGVGGEMFATRPEAEGYVAYVKSMSMGG